jgi:hypothetical protein
MVQMMPKPMTKEQKELIAAHGPYTLRDDGALIDGQGMGLAHLRPNALSEETSWDRAVVAALNDVWSEYESPEASGKRKGW